MNSGILGGHSVNEGIASRDNEGFCGIVECHSVNEAIASTDYSGILGGHSVNGLHLGKLVKEAHGLLESLSMIPDFKWFQYLIQRYTIFV